MRSRSLSRGRTRPRGSIRARRRATRAPTRPDASVSGTCRDRAGNTSASSSFGFQYDETGPVVTATPVAQPGLERLVQPRALGRFSGTDADLGPRSCVAPQAYSGPDSANASVSGSCVDQAGNTSVRSFALSYDGTAPQAFGAPARAAGLERLVQPADPGRLRRDGRHLGHRLVHCAAGLLGPGRRERLAQRRLHRPGRQHQRRRDVLARLRRHGPAGHRNYQAGLPTRTAGTTTC